MMNSIKALRSTGCFTAVVTLGLASVAGSAAAQGVDGMGFVVERPAKGSFNADRLSPAPGPRNFIATRTARSDGEKAFSIGGLVSYANEPIVVELPPEPCMQAADCTTHVIQNNAALHLMGAFVPTPWLQIGLRIPLVFSQGQGIGPTGKAAALEGGKGIKAWALSDPELEAKVRFLGDAQAPFVLGASLFGTAPFGQLTAKGSYVGSDSVTAGGRIIGDGKVGPFTYAANVGFRYQKPAKMVATVGSEGLYSVAVGLVPSPILRLMAEVFGSTQFSSELGTNTAELAVGAQFTPLSSPIAITLGGGPGLTQGAIGVAKFRVFAGLTFTQEKNDLDADNIADAADQCPTDKEDLDGVEDGDGCPDVDNDGDAIPDTADKCPNEGEDLDGFDDADGCPDKDNDKDAVPDVQDRCPAVAENVNGYQDEDGCPDVKDSDADGVPDTDDKCVEEKEDTDGFEDTDGCPDNDNDADGIPDTSDECIDQAEDMNGLQDSDGCPDLESE